MKHANAYVAQFIALYQLALAEYIKANKDTLDEIQAKMKDTVLRNAIVWSNTSLLFKSKLFKNRLKFLLTWSRTFH